MNYSKYIFILFLFSSLSFSNDILDKFGLDTNNNLIHKNNNNVEKETIKVVVSNIPPALDQILCTMEMREVFRINPETNKCEIIYLRDGCVIYDFFNGRHESSSWEECVK